MKVLLRSDQKRGEGLPGLGLGYIIAYLKKHCPELTVDISFDKEDMLKKIQSFKPDLIGFTAVTFTHKKVFQLAQTVKDHYPYIPLILGGVHITLCPQALPGWADVGVLGEGEETFLELIKTYRNEGQLKKEDVKGILFRKNGDLIKTEKRQSIEPIDEIPHPDLEALCVPKKSVSHIITSRGCPFRCKFCCSAKLWPEVRFHSAEYILEEIEKAVNYYQRRKVMIYDDLFTMEQKRIQKLAKLMEEKGLNKKVEFDVISHVDFVNAETVKNLKKMGVARISFGIESGSKKILDYLKNRVVTHDKIRNAVALCKKNGIRPMGSFMVGSPYETEEDIRQTIDFIKELDLDEIGLNVTTPFPGTEIWKYAKEKGLIENDEWDDRLWGMQHIDESNIDDKLILADVDKSRFLCLYGEMHNVLLKIVRRKELKNWLRRPYNLALLAIHMKGRVKTFKKRLKSKLKRLRANRVK